MSETMKRGKRFFAGANTSSGFINYYDDIFYDCDRIFIIKGGSGTGKSRFMLEVANAAEKKGKDVEFFYCAFDPSSVDGVIIDEKTAIIDGTAPHVCEPSLPGALEVLVDPGEFRDDSMLQARREEIAQLLKMKKDNFSMAYSYLSVVGGIDRARCEILKKYIKWDSLSGLAGKIAGRESQMEKGGRRVRITSSLGMNGRTHFDTFSECAEKSIVLSDEYGIGHFFLDKLADESERRGARVTVSYDPLFAKRVDALMLGDTSAVVIRGEEEGRLSEFLEGISDGEKEELIRLKAESNLFEKMAVEWLKKASEAHFLMESIYVSSMDFSRKEEFTKEFIARHV